MTILEELIDEIQTKIDEVPADENGFYSQGSQMFIFGLVKAQEIIKKKADENGLNKRSTR